MKPTQAQKEAAVEAIKGCSGEYNLYELAEKVLIAAAEVGDEWLANECMKLRTELADLKLINKGLWGKIDMLQKERAAAAAIGEPSGLEDGAYMIGYREGKRATIERCAQVADAQAHVEECADDTMRGVHNAAPYRKIAAAIRALKEKP